LVERFWRIALWLARGSSNVRTSLAGASGQADGALLSMRLTILDASCTARRIRRVRLALRPRGTGYEARVNKLAALRLASDLVSRDAAPLETPTGTGKVDAGFCQVTITP